MHAAWPEMTGVCTFSVFSDYLFLVLLYYGALHDR